MRAFEYSSANSVEEAIGLISEPEMQRKEAADARGLVRPLAGGTDLLTLIKADILQPIRLVDIKHLSYLNSGIKEQADGSLLIGALTRLAELEESTLIAGRYPALSQAASVAATPQLRNMATLGGNLLQRPRCWYFRNPRVLCWLKGGDECQARDGENQQHALFGDSPCVAVHPSDIAPALLALDAEVQLQGGDSKGRTLNLLDFFTLPSDDHRTETALRDDELIVSIRIRAPKPGARSTYLKAMDRKVWAFALVGFAASLSLNADGTISDARLVLSGVAPVPWHLSEAESVLVGERANEELLNRVADVALSDAEPLEHNDYKVPLARALILRGLRSLTGLSSPSAGV